MSVVFFFLIRKGFFFFSLNIYLKCNCLGGFNGSNYIFHISISWVVKNKNVVTHFILRNVKTSWISLRLISFILSCWLFLLVFSFLSFAFLYISVCIFLRALYHYIEIFLASSLVFVCIYISWLVLGFFLIGNYGPRCATE